LPTDVNDPGFVAASIRARRGLLICIDASGESSSTIAATLGASRATVYRALAESA
jgi:transposase